MFARPFTGSLSSSVRSLINFYSPAHAEDHLVQAWTAVGSALKGENEAGNIAFARTRLECARSEPMVRAVKPRSRKAYEAECTSLEAALNDYVL